MSHKPRNQRSRIRCAVYTRKSTDIGLEQEFNSLDAQREACENYIASQQQEGWTCLPRRYDDGGFTGGNIERPAVRQLLNNVQSGKIDCVVVYKVDRLSRSLLDFARMMEVFEQHQVSFVSVTQQFNTATSMGRLMLNVLLSFAQFERELISERTRDKMAAARRKGKRMGGRPVLGYDVDPQSRRLVVHPREAERVRAIFALYQELTGLIPTVRELARRGWVTKRWTTHNGNVVGGQPFQKAGLHHLLRNVTYRGKVKYEGRIYNGEHEAIVSEELFNAVQQRLSQNRLDKKPHLRTSLLPGILEGLLYCAPCDVRMRHTYTAKGSRRYRYYVCPHGREQGSETCSAGSIPAEELESFVWSELAKDSEIEMPLGDRGQLTSAQQTARLAQFVERVDYDGRQGDLTIRLTTGLEETS
jgi:site-specific DNA recombinase